VSITRSELHAIQQLAYLDPKGADADLLAKEINAIMDFVQELREIDTEGVVPLFHPMDLHQRLRADEVTEDNCLAELAGLAPNFADDLYLVPKVIDAGE